MKIEIKILDKENAVLPVQATIGDAGYDLYATEDCWLKPGERKLIKTGLAMAIPYGYYGRISPRSGLALKRGLDILAGTIDAGYRGDVGVLVYNTNLGDETNSIKIQKGEKIAQIIFQKCEVEVGFEVVENLPEANRGERGYGSSG